MRAVDAHEVEAAWTIVRDALPPGWRVRRPLYDPDGHAWSVWAVSRPPIRSLPIRGGGATLAAALVDLAAKLHGRPPDRA